jgi:phage FluMu protein gp41
LKSWDQALNEAELKETAPLITRIQTLQAGEGKGSTNYDPFPSASHSTAGLSDVELLRAPRQVENLGPRLARGCTRLRQLTKLTKEDQIPLSYRVMPYDATNAPSKVSLFDSLALLDHNNIFFAYFYLS